MEHEKTIINPAFIMVLGAMCGMSLYTKFGISTKSLMILAIITGVGIIFNFIGKKITRNIPLHNIRAIDGVVILTAPLSFFNYWVVVFILIVEAIILNTESVDNKIFKLKLIPILICYMVFCTAFFGVIHSDRFIDYKILIWSLYYLWSILYICKLQTIQIKIS